MVEQYPAVEFLSTLMYSLGLCKIIGLQSRSVQVDLPLGRWVRNPIYTHALDVESDPKEWRLQGNNKLEAVQKSSSNIYCQ